ncbi:hypothetical protein NDU88_002995 [Pleurodeles waltl]|uniref:Uncharacterized protein n=1 Tax=Pleurodeles waltl TaxID=8319 RepID=A0AAV7LE22_PLEWA|nr:hypothetical protein NDU88_002995 [Pleurodeles waltl]
MNGNAATLQEKRGLSRYGERYKGKGRDDGRYKFVTMDIYLRDTKSYYIMEWHFDVKMRMSVVHKNIRR